jgi:hypothetical protein
MEVGTQAVVAVREVLQIHGLLVQEQQTLLPEQVLHTQVVGEDTNLLLVGTTLEREEVVAETVAQEL